jgi:hypothetical protein
MERIVIRLGQIERVVVVRMVNPTVRVMVMLVVIVFLVIGVAIVVVIVVVVMMRREREEVVRVLVVAARVRVRDDARTRDGSRGEEGRQNGDDDGGLQAHDAGVLPHQVRSPGRRRMRPPHRMPCGMPLALTHSLPGAYARPRRSPVLTVAISRRA